MLLNLCNLLFLINLYLIFHYHLNIIAKVKFEKLEILHLGGNIISDKTVLKYTNFKKLKELDLFNYKI